MLSTIPTEGQDLQQTSENGSQKALCLLFSSEHTQDLIKIVIKRTDAPKIVRQPTHMLLGPFTGYNLLLSENQSFWRNRI